MIARRQLPPRHREWNDRWKAPFGNAPARMLQNLGPRGARAARFLGKRLPWLGGPFSLQANNSTREAEYPWAFHAVPVGRGHRVLEIGGGLAGFQFVLSSVGCEVHNVDPGEQQWPVNAEEMARLNRAFGTDVQLHNCYLSEARLDAGTFDVVYSISVLEHVPEEGAVAIVRQVHELLKPGGHLVMTVDLFLDLHPFTTAATNEYGANVSVERLASAAPFTLVTGDPRELFGFPEFDQAGISGRLDELLVGRYPALAQMLVLRKAD